MTLTGGRAHGPLFFWFIREYRGCGNTAQVWIELRFRPGRAKRCDGCGKAIDAMHGTVARWGRELRILDGRTHLLVGC